MPTLRNRSAAQVPGGVFDYTISQEFWKGKDGDGVDYQVAKRYGDFRETKGYIITGKAPVNGIVIQYINKRAKVELAKPVKIGGVLKNIVETSADIEALTKKSVKYMCDSYFEYFEIKGGKSIHGDQFQNGAIVPYLNAKTPETDNSIDVSRGAFTKADGVSRDGVGIVQIGLNIFIPEGPEAAAIRGEGWSMDESMPANGLPYLPYDPATWERYKLLSKSAVFKHQVEVAWGYKQAATSVVISNPPRLAGGRKSRKGKKGGLRKKRGTVKGGMRYF